jgi:malonyl-CoA O-methyltransferase
VSRIADQFSSAAHTYSNYAIVQRQAAQELLRWAAPLLPNTIRTAADIGCGTGFITEQLLRCYPSVSLEAIDIAPGMLNAAQQALAQHSNIKWTLANGETYLPSENIDLAISGMCFQWFEHLPKALAHWLEQAPMLCFSILLESSFKDWKKAHLQAKQPCGLRQLPNQAELLSAIGVIQEHFKQNALCKGIDIHMRTITIDQPCSSGLEFARSLRGIGATTPKQGHQPIALQRVLKQFKQPFNANYDLALVIIGRL